MGLGLEVYNLRRNCVFVSKLLRNNVFLKTSLAVGGVEAVRNQAAVMLLPVTQE